jgi:hypothetical protein
VATIFFATTRYYLVSNKNQRNSQKYGISWQSNDDFIYLGTTLILLIYHFPNYYPGTPLCPWLISTAFLEHIFGYARRIIEDFTVLDFLMMNEKIFKTISIEMKGIILSSSFIINLCKKNLNQYLFLPSRKLNTAR